MFTDPKVIEFLTNEMALVKIDAVADSLKAKESHISGYPTIIMIEQNGDEVDRVVGYLEPDSLIQKLRDYANGIGTLDDLLGKMAKKFDRKIAFEIGDKYKYRGGQEKARSWFQSVIDSGDPTDSLSGESRMALASIPYRDKNYDKAIKAYEKIMKDFQDTDFEEQSELWCAYIIKKKGDTTAAIVAFEEFVEHYPKSEEIEWIQGQISKLKGEEPKEEQSEETKEDSEEESKGEDEG